MITEAQIQDIIKAEIRLWQYPTSSSIDRAAKKIVEVVQKEKAKPLPPAHYPDPGCDCGAERAKASKHAVWCGLVAIRVRR